MLYLLWFICSSLLDSWVYSACTYHLQSKIIPDIIQCHQLQILVVFLRVFIGILPSMKWKHQSEEIFVLATRGVVILINSMLPSVSTVLSIYYTGPVYIKMFHPQAGKLKFVGTCPKWVVSCIAYTKFHSPRPVFHSPNQIFTRIGERPSTSFQACIHSEQNETWYIFKKFTSLFKPQMMTWLELQWSKEESRKLCNNYIIFGIPLLTLGGVIIELQLTTHNFRLSVIYGVLFETSSYKYSYYIVNYLINIDARKKTRNIHSATWMQNINVTRTNSQYCKSIQIVH